MVFDVRLFLFIIVVFAICLYKKKTFHSHTTFATNIFRYFFFYYFDLLALFFSFHFISFQVQFICLSKQILMWSIKNDDDEQSQILQVVQNLNDIVSTCVTKYDILLHSNEIFYQRFFLAILHLFVLFKKTSLCLQYFFCRL